MHVSRSFDIRSGHITEPEVLGTIAPTAGVTVIRMWSRDVSDDIEFGDTS